MRTRLGRRATRGSGGRGARAAALASSLLLCLGARGASGTPDETEAPTVVLAPARPPWPRVAPFAAASDVARPHGPTAVTATVSGVRVLLAPVRTDEVLDAWALARPGIVHWLPLSRPVVLPVAVGPTTEPREVEWTPAGDGRSMRSRSLPAPDVPWTWPKEWGAPDALRDTLARGEASISRTLALRTLLRLNDLRTRNGLPPGRLDPERSAEAFLHALYLSHTGEFGHEQRPGPWATAAGAASARRSGVSRDPDPAANLYLTILHRMIVFRRETTSFGIAAAGGITVLDGSVSGGDLPWSEAGECVPGPFAEGVPLVARDEIPRPHADQIQVTRQGVIGGFPITVRVGLRADAAIPDVEGGLVQLGKTAPAALEQVHANLRALADAWRSARRRALRPGAPADATAAAEGAHRAFLDGVRALRGKDVPVLLSWPGRPCATVGSDRSNGQAIALLPRNPLAAESTYLWWVLWTDLSLRDEDSPGGRPQRMVEAFTTGPAGTGVR